MSSQRYERVSGLRRYTIITDAVYVPDKNYVDNLCAQVSANDEDAIPEHLERSSTAEPIPSSPPPSFRSRASSPSSRRLLSSDPIASEAERTLADTFDDGSDSDDDENRQGDDRQRLMRASTTLSEAEQRVVHDGNRPDLSTTATRLPGQVPPATNIPARPYTGGAPFSSFSHSNDGVFANLNAKPERGEKLEEQPPVSLFPKYEFHTADRLSHSHTRPRLQMPRHLIGKLPSWPLVILIRLMMSMLMACLSVHSSVSCGMA